MPTSDDHQTIADLTASHRPGHSLAQAFYLRPDVFAADMRLLEDRWTLAGHVCEAAAPGDWFVAELGAQSAIIVRGEDGVVRALANVCRHRGSRVCVEKSGAGVMLTCPYHAWTFRLDGALRAAREMPEGFDPAVHGLLSLPIKIVGGLIFISFGDAPPPFGEAEAAIADMTRVYGWESARIAARKTFKVAANWKLVMENYHECYHCGPSHPEFAVLHALSRPNARALSSEPDPRTGLADFEAWSAPSDGCETGRVMRSALSDGCLTGSRDGRPLAPPMGAAGGLWNGCCVFGELGLLSAFLAYADHGVIYRFIPRAGLETEMEVIWLTAGDAVAGRDYDEEALTWLWDVTSREDKLIIERNQAGVSSRAYRPGPFSLMEPGTRAYVERYVAELASARHAP
jgi:phenylpropionate dioxygenase-like ring-hydroxylating dioxygenase large terminal subunit